MFYVADGKFYLTEKDEGMKVYPEVAIEVGEQGGYTVTKLGGGSAKKPKGRELLSAEEIIAQYALKFEPEPAEVSEPEPPKAAEPKETK